MSINPVRADYPRVIPYLTIDGAAAAIEFYCSVLDATERCRMPMPGGNVGHAELQLGDSVIMLADPSDCSGPPPGKLGGSPVSVMVYVPDVDATYHRALEAGAESMMEPANQFYGDRSAAFTDPFGHKWHVASHIEDVAPEEMERRMAELFATQ